MLTRGEVISDLLAVTPWSPAFRCCLILNPFLKPDRAQKIQCIAEQRREEHSSVCVRARVHVYDPGCSHSAGTELKSLPTP